MPLHYLLLLVCFGDAPSGPAAELAAAERGFAQTSREKGTAPAFFTWMDETSVLFRPEPVNGKDYYKGKKRGSGELFWQPAMVTTSQDGLLGFSTGPYQFKTAEGNIDGSGHYFSMWHRREDGTWRVLIDHGVSHDPIARQDWPATRQLPQAQRAKVFHKDEMLARDRAYDEAAGSGTWADAFSSFAAGDVLLFRKGHLPVHGREDARKLVQGRARWQPVGGRMAGSGDLGYTYGLGTLQQDGETRPILYIRVWRAGPQGLTMMAELVRTYRKPKEKP